MQVNVNWPLDLMWYFSIPHAVLDEFQNKVAAAGKEPVAELKQLLKTYQEKPSADGQH